MNGGGYPVETWVEASIQLGTEMIFSKGPGDTVLVIVGQYIGMGKGVYSALDNLRDKLEQAAEPTGNPG